MPNERIEAIYEGGVFRPLQPIQMPEHQRVTLVLPANGEAVKSETLADDEFKKDVSYEPMPLQQCATIRVKLTPIGELPADHQNGGFSRKPGKRKRVKLPMVEAADPDACAVTNQHIAEVLEKEDVRQYSRFFRKHEEK